MDVLKTIGGTRGQVGNPRSSTAIALRSTAQSRFQIPVNLLKFDSYVGLSILMNHSRHSTICQSSRCCSSGRLGDASLILALTMSCLNTATKEWEEFELSATLFTIGGSGIVISMAGSCVPSL